MEEAGLSHNCDCRHPPIKRLEYSLEDQIYRILRKARIITNVASNSLFAVPANQEFVYVETGGQVDPASYCYFYLLHLVPWVQSTVDKVVPGALCPGHTSS